MFCSQCLQCLERCLVINKYLLNESTSPVLLQFRPGLEFSMYVLEFFFSGRKKIFALSLVIYSLNVCV